MDYYSLVISIICIVDDGKIPVDGYTQDIQVHIVRAKNFEHAEILALEIGLAEEKVYKNGDGHNVHWKLKEIEHIRKLGKEVTRVEIFSRFDSFSTNEVYDGETSFKPESSSPNWDDESN